jgi:hypothetical protein
MRHDITLRCTLHLSNFRNTVNGTRALYAHTLDPNQKLPGKAISYSKTTTPICRPIER